jgi:hypothetical protein
MKLGFHLGSPFNLEVCLLNKSYKSLYHQMYHEEPGVPVSKAMLVMVDHVVVLLTNMVFSRLRLHMMAYNCSSVAAVKRIRL